MVLIKRKKRSEKPDKEKKEPENVDGNKDLPEITNIGIGPGMIDLEEWIMPGAEADAATG